MLGIESLKDDAIFSETDYQDLVDHTLGIKRSGVEETPMVERPKLAWDGRKGQWIPVAFSYTFPSNAFDQVIMAPCNNGADRNQKMMATCRSLCHFSFPPSKRHAVMLDPGSPRLRVFPKLTVTNSRYPTSSHKRFAGRNARVAPNSPLTSRRPTPEETEDETEVEKGIFELFDPFGTDDCDNEIAARIQARPMTWLDDANIEDFLSSAVDYQVDSQLLANLNPNLSSMPLVDPIITASSLLSRIKRTPSDAAPSIASPPPPLFPGLRITPPKL